ncbi:MAG: hypothetical protein ACK8QZ_01565 [Anaerolineales bacterium]
MARKDRRHIADLTESERLAQYKQSERYQAYQAQMQTWRQQQEEARRLEQADLTEAEADAFVRQARANGSIASVQGAAGEYAARKQAAEQAQAERAAAYHAWRVEETTYTLPPPPTSTAPQSQNGEPDSATRSYQAWAKAIEEKKFDLKSYTQQMRLLSQFQELGITLHAGFTISEANVILNAANRFAVEMGGPKNFRQELGPIRFIKDDTMPWGGTGGKGQVSLRTGFTEWTVAHELAHAWDANHGWRLSEELERYTGGYTLEKSPYGFVEYCAVYDPYQELPGCNDAHYFYGDVPPKTSDRHFNRLEDFAESVTAYLYPEQAKKEVQEQLRRYEKIFGEESPNYRQYETYLHYTDFRSTKRGKFVTILFKKATP